MKEVFPDHLADSMAYFITQDSKRSWFDNDKLSTVKPIDRKVLEDKYIGMSIFSPSLMCTEVMNNLIIQVNAHFEGVLEKKGISFNDWKEFGHCTVINDKYEYYYKDKCIFRTKLLPYEIEQDNNSFKGELQMYWEEPDDCEINKKES